MWRPIIFVTTMLMMITIPISITVVVLAAQDEPQVARSISFQRLFPAAAVDPATGLQRVNVREVARMVSGTTALNDILANVAFKSKKSTGKLSMKTRLFHHNGPLRRRIIQDSMDSFQEIPIDCADGGGGGGADGACSMVVADMNFIFQLCRLIRAYTDEGLSTISDPKIVPTSVGTATCKRIATTVVAACTRAHTTNTAEVRELCAPRQFYMYTELVGLKPGIADAAAARVPLGRILQVHVPSTWARHRAGPAPPGQICFHPTAHRDHKQGAEFAQMAERLAKHTSQGRSFLKADQRLTLGVALGKHLTRDPVVDKDVHPVAFRSAVQYVRKIIFATLSDRDDTCPTANGSPSAEKRAEKVVDHLRYYLRSRVWRLDYKTSPCDATDELEAFIVESSATLYALTRMGSNTYNIVRANSRMDAALQKSLGLKSPYLLASYKKMLVYLNDNFKKDWEEESYQLQARYTKGGHVVHGGAMSSLRATKNILTNEASLAVVDKYHDKDLMPNFLVLENVKFDDDSATWDTSKIRWPTNLDYYTDEQRADVCGHSNLRGLSALCTPGRYLSNARVALSAPAGTPADALGYVMLLQVPPTLWGYFQKVHVEDPNSGADMPSATIDIATELKSTFKARVVYNWKERCDIGKTVSLW
jgi:hypothetical protein